MQGQEGRENVMEFLKGLVAGGVEIDNFRSEGNIGGLNS